MSFTTGSRLLGLTGVLALLAGCDCAGPVVVERCDSDADRSIVI